MLDLIEIQKQFPILSQTVHDQPLVYLDNAATNQKPQSVIDAITHYYQHDNANIHRGVHTLSVRATQRYESVRHQVKQFMHAEASYEAVFVRGTTEAINLVANAYVKALLKAEDEILISTMEHHSNIVPWQQLCKQTGAVLKVAPITALGDIDLTQFEAMLTEKTKFVALTHVSNAIGTVNPVQHLVDLVKAKQIPILLDGAQAVPHMSVNLERLSCDFYAFSGHKCYGPTGIGVLFAKKNLLENMSPYQTGGDMIKSVRFEETTYNDVPYKFEAGTPNIAGVIGLGAAITFMQSVGLEAIANHEAQLMQYAEKILSQIAGIRFIGSPQHRAGALSFVMDTVHPHDVGTILDQEGVAVRTGHHCAMPLIEFYQVPATVRLSFAVYNTTQDIDVCAQALKKVKEVFHL